MHHAFLFQGVEHLLWLSRGAAKGDYRLDMAGCVHDVSLAGGRLFVDAKAANAWVAVEGDRIHVHVDGEAHELVYRDPISRHGKSSEGSSDRILLAPMPGTVVALPVAPGQAVAAGEILIVIESMKLETAIRSPRAGIVETVHQTPGQTFERDAPLVTLAED
jgi:biotin carboxyl carrier protein